MDAMNDNEWCATELTGGVLVFHLKGEMSAVLMPSVRTYFLEICKRTDFRGVVMDLDQVSAQSVEFLGNLVAFGKRIALGQKRLILSVESNQSTTERLHKTGTGAALPIYSSLQEAILAACSA